MKIYKSTETLPIYNFEKILETNDLRFLLKDYDHEEDSKPLKMSDEMLLSSIFKVILKEYSYLSGAKEIMRKMKSQFYIKELEIKITIIEELLDIFVKFGESTQLVLLNDLDLGIRFDEGGNEDKKVLSIKSKLSGLKTKLRLKKNTYEAKYKPKENVSSNSIFKTAIQISRALELGFVIDLKKTSVASWLYYLEECKKLSEDG